MSAAVRCLDIGATSVKACLVDDAGVWDKASRRTKAPLAPERLVELLASLSERMGPATRTGVGFPGVVRQGIVQTATNLEGPGGGSWVGFDLAGELEQRLGGEVRVANDADAAALACSKGTGVELTVSLGTGVGTGLVVDGVLQHHLELSELTLGGSESLDAHIGEPARKMLETEEWDRRVVEVLELFDRLLGFDRLWLCGGNARRLTRDRLGPLEERTWVVSEPVGLLGAARLFG